MLTTKDISMKLNVSEETVRRWIRSGELKAQQDGKSYIVEELDLEDFVEKKSKEKGTSLSQKANLLHIDPLMGSSGFLLEAMKNLPDAVFEDPPLTEPKSKEITSLNKILSMYNSSISLLNIEDIDFELQRLEIKKQRLELDYKMKILELEKMESNYRKLKEKLINQHDNKS
ncbi:helix-turn-helix domain-containing protein [Bacillus sp. Marseille-P3661]|uniref:helix-turn-helix domain-containing protein n=1 Tax=Bacillus sp. Marseille-P3661 TaxID=1936234 RepID=UPI000C82E175|nr:helix-turn-helix domain-containing protein [Bacillus sp. Marseille-P3661]